MLLWAIEATTLAGLLLALWFNDRTQKSVLVWGLGFAAHGVGVALVGARGLVPDVLSIFIANGLVLVGIGAWCIGVRLYDGLKPRLILMLPPMLAWFVSMQFPAIYGQFWARVFVIQLCAAFAYGLLGYLLVAKRLPPRGPRVIFCCVCLLQATTMVVTAFSSLIMRPQTFSAIPNMPIYTVIGIVCLVSGIVLGTQLVTARTEEKLKRLVVTDPLTGVLNRRGFLDAFEAMRLRPPPGKRMLALTIFDLDHFKDINDHFGHTCGDAVLVAFCRAAQDCIGQHGVFGRIGGEEFASLLHVSNADEAVDIAETVRLALMKQRIDSAGPEKPLAATVSAGITLTPAMSAKIDHLLAVADRALYAAKSAGRNGVVLDDGATATLIGAGERRLQDDTQAAPAPGVALFPSRPLSAQR